MTEESPSIIITIDEGTQNVTIKFRPQRLMPAQYGVCIASLMMHLARMFKEANPECSEPDIVEDIQRGIDAGIDQQDDMVVHSQH